jgi:hypothetical protein
MSLAFFGRSLHARRSQGVAWGNPPMFGPAPDYQSGAGLFNDKLTIRLRNNGFERIVIHRDEICHSLLG